MTSGYFGGLSGVWCVDQTKGRELLEFARRRMAGWRPSPDERETWQAARTERHGGAPRAGQGAIAVIPVLGTLVHRGGSLMASSGAMSAEAIGRLVDEAHADDDITRVVFDFDSPGGHVSGIPELAAKIRRLSARKPTVAAVNADACSAAYWLATQCRSISITPSGACGSIGVYLLLLDERKALDKEGVEIVPIFAGRRKLEGASFLELSAEARAHFQEQVDRVYQQFVGDVARGRGITVAQVESRFGQGRVFDASTAVALGMADRIEPFDGVVERLVTERPGRQIGGRADPLLTLARLDVMERS